MLIGKREKSKNEKILSIDGNSIYAFNYFAERRTL
jgi:hypothetical protein